MLYCELYTGTNLLSAQILAGCPVLPWIRVHYDATNWILTWLAGNGRALDHTSKPTFATISAKRVSRGDSGPC